MGWQAGTKFPAIRRALAAAVAVVAAALLLTGCFSAFKVACTGHGGVRFYLSKPGIFKCEDSWWEGAACVNLHGGTREAAIRCAHPPLLGG